MGMATWPEPVFPLHFYCGCCGCRLGGIVDRCYACAEPKIVKRFADGSFIEERNGRRCHVWIDDEGAGRFA